MNDDDLRQVFARLDEHTGELRPEFVEQLMVDFDARVATSGPAAESAAADRPRGGAIDDPYLTDHEDHPRLNLVGPRPRKTRTRVIVCLAVAAVIAVVAALVARPDSDHHQTRVGTHPPTTQPALNPTQAYLNDIHGPYQSYHFALNRASTACFTWGVSVVANCHTQAQDAVAAAEQLLVVLAQATPPPTLTAASQQIRSAVTNVVTYLNAAIAAATANNPGAVRAAAGNFLGADADLCGPIGRLNQFAPSGAGQFTNQSSNDCNS